MSNNMFIHTLMISFCFNEHTKDMAPCVWGRPRRENYANFTQLSFVTFLQLLGDFLSGRLKSVLFPPVR